MKLFKAYLNSSEIPETISWLLTHIGKGAYLPHPFYMVDFYSNSDHRWNIVQSFGKFQVNFTLKSDLEKFIKEFENAYS
jgi:hypothetical protein